MTEATLSITNPDEILTLFGPRDQHLRKLRRLFDVRITQRDGRIRISGEAEEAVQRATRTLEKLRNLSRQKGDLNPGDIDVAASEEGALIAGTSLFRLPPPRAQERRYCGCYCFVAVKAASKRKDNASAKHSDVTTLCKRHSTTTRP